MLQCTDPTTTTELSQASSEVSSALPIQETMCQNSVSDVSIDTYSDQRDKNLSKSNEKSIVNNESEKKSFEIEGETTRSISSSLKSVNSDISESIASKSVKKVKKVAKKSPDKKETPEILKILNRIKAKKEEREHKKIVEKVESEVVENTIDDEKMKKKEKFNNIKLLFEEKIKNERENIDENGEKPLGCKPKIRNLSSGNEVLSSKKT